MILATSARINQDDRTGCVTTVRYVLVRHDDNKLTAYCGIGSEEKIAVDGDPLPYDSAKFWFGRKVVKYRYVERTNVT